MIARVRGADDAVAHRPVVDPDDRQDLPRDARDEGLRDLWQLVDADRAALDGHESLRDLEHERARHADERALLLRSQHAADDGEEVAREPLEEGPVLAQESPSSTPAGSLPYAAWAVAMKRVSLAWGFSRRTSRVTQATPSS